MSTKTARKVPSLRQHKASGQGLVVLNGQAIYLGRFDLPETEQRYHQVIAEWLAGGKQAKVEPEQLTVNEMLARFWVHANGYYVKPNGEATTEIENIKQAVRPLRQIYGHAPAAEFGPLALKAVRQRMIQVGWCRTNINKMVGRIKLVFRWATGNELISGGIYQALQAVGGLKRGRCEVKESAPVRPVPQKCVDAIQPFVSRQVWAMVQLQLLTAARAGEIVIMRSGDIDRSGKIWLYTPSEHKTAHHGHERTIYIGPRGQEVLRPFLLRPAEAFCFSPAEAEAERRSALHEARKTPLDCGNGPGTHRQADPERRPGDVYDVATYRRAIARACDQAFPPPEHLAKWDGEPHVEWKARLTKEQHAELQVWRKAHRWHPHQLRHNAATHLRKEIGLEAARIILGHRSAAITEVYAELDRQKAIDSMLKIG